MKTIEIRGAEPSARQLNELVRDLRAGAVMIWPTDTLYGIACSALDAKAVEKICRIKGIDPDKTNLSIVCSSISQAAEYARIPDNIFRLMRLNTPGPFTFICKAANALPKVMRGRRTVGIRIPDSSIDFSIVEALGNPVMTTSVKADDDDYLRNPSLLEEIYGHDADILLSAGDGGTENSTIVDCTGAEPVVIRQGAGWLE